ncbi:MAG: endo-1,3-alpha-glucanase family glycosylhydrolase [Candidatus Thiodiazotropha sp.]
MLNKNRRMMLKALAVGAINIFHLSNRSYAGVSKMIPVAGDKNKKLVFAHYMTGKGTRRRKQTVEDWKNDILDAMSYGIDGWQFNFGHFRGRFQRNVETFIEALEDLGEPASDFLFFPSFDCNRKRKPDIKEINTWFLNYYNHPNHFRLNNLPLLTVWQARRVGNDYFQNVKEILSKSGMPISFVPWLATKANYRQMKRLFDDWSSMDGFFPWVPGKSADLAVRYNEIAAKLCREQNKTLIGGQGFNMLHINKAPIYVNKHAAEAISTQMNPFVNGDISDCRILNIATWNDFGEDHHITPFPPYIPKRGKHPVWCHIGYATILKYYLDWWKSEAKPIIDEDTLCIFHLSQMAMEGDPPFPIHKYKPDRALDIVYVSALLTAPATITVISGSNKPIHFDALEGISHWRAPSAPGRQHFQLARDKKIIINRYSGREISSPPVYPWSWSHYSEVIRA